MAKNTKHSKLTTSGKLKNWSDAMINDAFFFLENLFGKVARRAVDNIRKNDNVETNALVRSVKAKVQFKQSRAKERRGGSVWAGVGIDKDVQATKNGKISRPVHYAHLIEKGFTHYPDGKKIKGKPFLMPAVNSVSGGSKAIERKLTEIITNASKGVENKFEDFKMEFKK